MLEDLVAGAVAEVIAVVEVTAGHTVDPATEVAGHTEVVEVPAVNQN